jgi:hypothetical protein
MMKVKGLKTVLGFQRFDPNSKPFAQHASCKNVTLGAITGAILNNLLWKK